MSDNTEQKLISLNNLARFKSHLSTVAVSGDYNDLSNKIAFQSTYSPTTNKAATMSDITDTKNTTGSSQLEIDNQIYLVGAKTQNSTGVQTYSSQKLRVYTGQSSTSVVGVSIGDKQSYTDNNTGLWINQNGNIYMSNSSSSCGLRWEYLPGGGTGSVTTSLLETAAGELTLNGSLITTGDITSSSLTSSGLISGASIQAGTATGNHVSVGSITAIDDTTNPGCWLNSTGNFRASNYIKTGNYIHSGTYLKSETYAQIGTYATIGTDLTVNGSTTLGNLTATTTTISGALTAGSTLSVAGATTINSTLTVAGGNLRITGGGIGTQLDASATGTQVYAVVENAQTQGLALLVGRYRNTTTRIICGLIVGGYNSSYPPNMYNIITPSGSVTYVITNGTTSSSGYLGIKCSHSAYYAIIPISGKWSLTTTQPT